MQNFWFSSQTFLNVTESGSVWLDESQHKSKATKFHFLLNWDLKLCALLHTLRLHIQPVTKVGLKKLCLPSQICIIQINIYNFTAYENTKTYDSSYCTWKSSSKLCNSLDFATSTSLLFNFNLLTFPPNILKHDEIFTWQIKPASGNNSLWEPLWDSKTNRKVCNYISPQMYVQSLYFSSAWALHPTCSVIYSGIISSPPLPLTVFGYLIVLSGAAGKTG